MRQTKGVVGVCRSGRMAVYTKDTGSMTRLQGEADLFMRMVIYTKANGKMTRHTDQASTRTLMALATMVIGSMTFNTGTGRRPGRMVQSMKAPT